MEKGQKVKVEMVSGKIEIWTILRIYPDPHGSGLILADIYKGEKLVNGVPLEDLG